MSICIVPAEFHEPIIDRFTISEVNSVVNQRQKLEGADFKSSFTLNSISDECCRYRKVGALQLNGFCGPISMESETVKPKPPKALPNTLPKVMPTVVVATKLSQGLSVKPSGTPKRDRDHGGAASIPENTTQRRRRRLLVYR